MEREMPILKSMAISERRKSVEKAWRLRQEFLIFAAKNGADLQKFRPENSPSWRRRLEIVDDINFNSATVASAAREQEIDRRAVHQLYIKGMRGLWNNLSEEDREKFPWETIKSARKPVSLDKRRENSIAHGGSAVLIEEAFARGDAKSQPELRKVTGLSGPRLDSAKRTVGAWGYDIPKRYPSPAFVKEKLDEAKNDRQKRRILNQLSPGSLRTLAKRYPEDLISMKAVLKNAGFHVASRSKDFKDIQSLIRSSGIPIWLVENKGGGKVVGRYIILLRQYEARIADLLNNDPKLAVFKTNPVKRIPAGDNLLSLPSYSDLINKDKFGRVGSLAERTGIKFGLYGDKIISVKTVFEGCPVPLWRYKSGKNIIWYYSKPQEPEVLDFLNQKYGLKGQVSS